MKKHLGFRPILTVTVCLALLGALIYGFRFFISPGTDPELIKAVLDSVYLTLPVKEVTTTPSEARGGIRCDRLVIDRGASIVRANLAITEAVKSVGGEVVYGVESIDSHRRWQIVTLGISDGDSVIREIRLEKRIK